jgi:hypothetical protein
MAELSEAADKAGGAKRLAESAAEEVVDVAKESIARNHVAWMWGGFFTGVALGGGIGYFATRRYLEPKYAEIAENEISDMRKHFAKRSMARKDKPPIDDLNKRVEDLRYREGRGPVVKPNVPVAPAPPGAPNEHVHDTPNPAQHRNVFQADPSASEGWDYEVEKALREDKEIYVIHADEFGETDLNEAALTYYSGDDVLCDASDRIIDNQDRLVGEGLNKFGHGSGDKDVVFIRNETLAVDLEVTNTDKSYAEEVHGLKHEDPPRRKIPKYRE